MNNRVDKYSLTCFLMTAEAREFTPQWKAMRIDSSIFSQVGDVNICGSSGEGGGVAVVSSVHRTHQWYC